jgi:hypothetical protein
MVRVESGASSPRCKACVNRVEPVNGIGQHLRQGIVARRGHLELAQKAVVGAVARGERAVDRAAGKFAGEPGDRHDHVGRAEFVEDEAPPARLRRESWPR